MVTRKKSVQSSHRIGPKKGPVSCTCTHHSSIPLHLVTVPTAIVDAKVQQLVHIADKVDEELEYLERGVGQCGATDKVGQDGADILYGVKDVGAIGAHLAVHAGELAAVQVVADAFGVVQWGGPACTEADLVGPSGDGHEVAGRIAVCLCHLSVISTVAAAIARAIAIGTEDGADGGQDLWVKVQLGEGSDDFVAFWREISRMWGGKLGVAGKMYLLRPRLSCLGLSEMLPRNH